MHGAGSPTQSPTLALPLRPPRAQPAARRSHLRLAIQHRPLQAPQPTSSPTSLGHFDQAMHSHVIAHNQTTCTRALMIYGARPMRRLQDSRTRSAPHNEHSRSTVRPLFCSAVPYTRRALQCRTGRLCSLGLAQTGSTWCRPTPCGTSTSASLASA
jgi:hypothetical protein